MRSIGILLSIWLSAVSAVAQASNDKMWRGLAGEAAKAGLDAEQVEALVTRCRDAGLTVETARIIASPLMEACRRRLPTEPVLAKIDEGLAKRVGADRIARAAGVRIEKLEQAARLVEAQRSDDPRGGPGLVAATALALESGVSEGSVAGLLSHPNSKRPGWLMAAIEGMETLHAQGFPDADAQRLMQDALSRGLRRQEILQGVDLALQQYREGQTSAKIAIEAASPNRPGRHGGNGGPSRRR